MQIDYDLAGAGFCFANITPDMFAVDEHTGLPTISIGAFQDLVPVRSTDKEAKVNSNMRDIATIIEDDIIGTVKRPLLRDDLNVIQISVPGG